MKRIALLLLLGFYFVACNNPVDPNTGGDGPDHPGIRDVNALSVRIHVPNNNATTYSGEDAYGPENQIDSVYIDLYQGSTVPIHEGRFGFNDFNIVDDSTINIAYEVDNITIGALTARVYANKKEPEKISSEIDLPSINPFYMSNESPDLLTFSGSAYYGDIHIQRNVAKLRVLVTRSDAAIPSDLIIDYDNVRIQVFNVPDSTTAFGNVPIDGISSINYFHPDLPPYNAYYADHTGTALRKITNPLPLPPGGGQIDSLYIYENLRTGYSYNPNPDPTDRTTKVRVTIPTLSNLEGNKSASYTYTLYTDNANEFKILRNYIYTLNIVVKGQELDPLISLDVTPWNDVSMPTNIGGTYLTVDQSEIKFDNTGKAFINFCSDAQAIYFDFTDFNLNNPTAQFGVGGPIKPIDIDTTRANFPHAPTGFQSAQILLDKQHCGRFGFELEPSHFPGFPNVTFSGQICMKAGNIVKCLTFPSFLTYDAHFIVGEPIFTGELFTSAVVSSGSTWMEVSPDRLYTSTAGTSYPLGGGSGAETQIYLHLNENLTANSRTGTITFRNTVTSVEKVINITQLPAIYAGRFGYNGMSSVDDSIYTAYLYTEQLKEFGTAKPLYSSSVSTPLLPNNALYNGRFSPVNMTGVFDWTNYSAGFNYQSAVYSAINYCAYKNRHEPKTVSGALEASDIKWYLPSQAQLMGMWISNEYYKDFATSNFFCDTCAAGSKYPDIFWSSTHNLGHPPYPPTQAQYVDFRHGNVGHYERTQSYWVRCVRDGEAPTFPMVVNDVISGIELPQIYFDRGLPPSITTVTDKVGVYHHENEPANREVYMQLRVAKYDYAGGASVPWSLGICSDYNHPDEAAVPPFAVWRLPTQRELQAIWVLQHEMKSTVPSFNLLADEYYWSGTEVFITFDPGLSTYSSAWTVFGNGSRTEMGGAGNTPHQIKTTPLRVRCVLQH